MAKNKKTNSQNNIKKQVSAPEAEKQLPSNNKSETKKSRGCLTCGIVAAVVAVLVIIGFIALSILRFWLPPTFLFGIISQLKGVENISQLSDLGSKTYLSGKKQPVANTAKAVKKMITAKDGGSIEVTTESGLTTTIIIPPGSLEEDTEIELAPNENIPDGTEGPGSTEDPGVTVGPPGTTFDPAATIVFSYIPTQLTGSVVPGAGSGFSRPATGENENRNSERRFPDDAEIVVTSAGASNPAPTEHADDGSSISGPIGGSGAAEPDNPTPEESEDMAETAAAASGGTCSPEFLQAMAGASQAGGPGSQAAQAAIRDCLNTEWLNNLCVNDPVKLRRTHFEQRLVIARRFNSQAAVAIESLMNQCQAKYRFRGEGINPESTADVTIFSSFDATVCGYVDDEWTAHEIYRLSGGYNTVHSIEGTGEFSLPSGGGSFAGTAHGENQMAVVGQGVAIPNFDAGFHGYFDGIKTIQNLYLAPAGVVVSSAPIELQGKDCVPLAPLPR